MEQGPAVEQPGVEQGPAELAVHGAGASSGAARGGAGASGTSGGAGASSGAARGGAGASGTSGGAGASSGAARGGAGTSGTSGAWSRGQQWSLGQREVGRALI